MITLKQILKNPEETINLNVKPIVFIILGLLFSSQLYSKNLMNDTIPNRSFDIAIKNTGIGFGNSERFNGVRFNAVDRGVRTINGLNFTLWKSEFESNPNSVNNGIAIGLVSPYAAQINGLALGTGAAGGQINGLALGILGVGTEENMNGFAFGGLGVGSGENMNGIMIGGLGAGSGGSANGVLIGGLGVGASEDVNGFIFGTLGAGSGGNMKGIGIGGIGIGAGGDAAGLMLGGVGVGCAGTFKGIAFGGLGVGSGETFSGIGLTAGMIKTPELKGLAVGSYVNVDESFGLTIALFNRVKKLHGVQLGIINYAGNNPKGLRVLPLMNMHF